MYAIHNMPFGPNNIIFGIKTTIDGYNIKIIIILNLYNRLYIHYVYSVQLVYNMYFEVYCSCKIVQTFVNDIYYTYNISKGTKNYDLPL